MLRKSLTSELPSVILLAPNEKGTNRKALATAKIYEILQIHDGKKECPASTFKSGQFEIASINDVRKRCSFAPKSPIYAIVLVAHSWLPEPNDVSCSVRLGWGATSLSMKCKSITNWVTKVPLAGEPEEPSESVGTGVNAETSLGNDSQQENTTGDQHHVEPKESHDIEIPASSDSIDDQNRTIHREPTAEHSELNFTGGADLGDPTLALSQRTSSDLDFVTTVTVPDKSQHDIAHFGSIGFCTILSNKLFMFQSLCVCLIVFEFLADTADTDTYTVQLYQHVRLTLRYDETASTTPQIAEHQDGILV